METFTVTNRKKPRRFRRFALTLLVLLLLIVVAAISLWAVRPTGIRHYLLIGKDSWEGLTPNEEGRTDVMMLVTFDFQADRILMASFLRDILVDMPGGGQSRLNAIARRHGDDALRRYLEETYHISIAGVFGLNFNGAVRVVDALGGVTVDLTRAEVSYLRRVVGDQGSQFTLRSGSCRLNGAQALEYMRCRSLDSDFGRTSRQANVMNALIQEMRAVSLDKVLRLVPGLVGFFNTDLGLGEQLALARDVYSLRNAKVGYHQVPASGTYRHATVNGAAVLKIDVEKNKRLLEAFWAGK